MAVTMSNGIATDKAYLLIKPSNIKRSDNEVDAEKLHGNLFGVSFISDKGIELVNHVAPTDRDIEIGIMSNQEGEFSLQFSNFESMQYVDNLYLNDRYLQSSSRVNNDRYFFKVSKNESSFRNRFFLSGKPKFSSGEKDLVRIHMFPNPAINILNIEIVSTANVPVILMDNNGVILKAVDLPSDGSLAHGELDITNQVPGVYIIKAEVNGKVVYGKAIKK